MNRLKMSFSVFALLLLVFVFACNRTGADNNGESPRAENKVAPETPAPHQPAGKEFVYNFDSDAVGKLPARFHDALTGQEQRDNGL